MLFKLLYYTLSERLGENLFFYELLTDLRLIITHSEFLYIKSDLTINQFIKYLIKYSHLYNIN